MILMLLPGAALSEDRLVRLYAAEALVQSGLIRHIVPRFALKTQVRIEIVGDAASADARLANQGRALFTGLGQTWHVELRDPDHPGTQKFASWLGSKVGQRTIQGFAPEGAALFGPPKAIKAAAVVVDMDGDAVLGKQVSKVHCARCHVTEKGAGWGIGSTPSFSVLRSFDDWEGRFTAFYVLKPHGAFTQITDVTEPFPADRPSPIAPITLDLEEVEAILAYVAIMPAADLGAPLDHQ